jgi:SAM-dependent methyltransferase
MTVDMFDHRRDSADHAPDATAYLLMLEFVRPGQRVLEVGCATGELTEMLFERGCSVVGVETDPVTAERASASAERIVVGDPETMDFVSEFHGEAFDVILFGDVLSHVRDPAAVLGETLKVLAEEGYLVMTIPNVAHGDLRLSLLRGEFRYRPSGLLDAEHVRFFTRDTIEDLLRSAGFISVSVKRHEVPLFATELALARDEFDPELIERVEAEPESHTYQFVVKALPRDRTEGLRELHDRAERHRIESETYRRQVMELERTIDEAEREIEFQRIEIAGLRRRGEEQLRKEEQQLRKDEEELRKLEDQLRESEGHLSELSGELNALRSTRLFRWAVPLRRLYGLARRLR